MKPQKQKVFDKEKGDCVRACVASILEIKNDDNFYKIKEGSGWILPLYNKLEEWGLRLNGDKDAIWRSGYWIASVPSKNFKEVSHAIVMKDSKVSFDPSTHKKYKTGLSLLGKDIVTFGQWIEVSDFSKLKRSGIIK